MKWVFKFFILGIIFISIPLSATELPSDLSKKTQEYVVLKTMAHQAQFQAEISSSISEKQSYQKLAQIFEEKASEIYETFKAPLEEIQKQIETYITFHFMLRLVQEEENQGRKESALNLIETFAKEVGIDASAIYSEHKKLHALFGDKPEFQEFDANIDRLLRVSKMAEQNNASEYERELKNIPDSPFKNLLISAWKTIREEIGKREKLETEFGSRELDFNRYAQGALQDRGEDRNYYERLNEYYPQLRKIFYLKIRELLNGKISFESFYPSNPDTVSHRDFFEILSIYVNVIERHSHPDPQYIFKKVDWWSQMTGSQPTMMPLSKGSLLLLGQASAIGTVLITSGYSAIILGPSGTLGVVAMAALFAKAPDWNHVVFGTPEPNTTFTQRFVTNVIVMLPMAALFNGLSFVLPRTAYLLGGGLITYQTIDAFSDQRYFEGIFSALLTLGITVKATKIFFISKNSKFPVLTPKTVSNRNQISEDGYVIPRGNPKSPLEAMDAHYEDTILNDPYIQSGGIPSYQEPVLDPHVNNPSLAFLENPSEWLSSQNLFSLGQAHGLDTAVLPKTAPRLAPTALLPPTKGGQNVTGGDFILFLDPEVHQDLSFLNGIFKSYETRRKRQEIITGTPYDPSHPPKKIIIIIIKDPSDPQNPHKRIGLMITTEGSKTHQKALSNPIQYAVFSFNNTPQTEQSAGENSPKNTNYGYGASENNEGGRKDLFEYSKTISLEQSGIHSSSFGKTLHYRTHFDIVSTNAQGDLPWASVVQQIYQWVLSHSRDFTLPIDQFMAGGTWENPEIAVVTEKLVGTGSEVIPQYWAVRVQHPDRGSPGRSWRVDMALTVREKSIQCVVGVYRWLMPETDSLRESKAWPSSPRIVREILHPSEGKNWKTKSAELDVSDQYHELHVGEATQFKTMLEDPQRSLPIVYVSRLSTGKLPIDPKELAQKLLGMAIVYVEGDSQFSGNKTEIQEEHEHIFPSKMRATYGKAKIFFPNLDWEKAEEHPTLLPPTATFNQKAFINKIYYTILRYLNVKYLSNWTGIFRGEKPIQDILDIVNLKQSLELQAIQQRSQAEISPPQSNVPSEAQEWTLFLEQEVARSEQKMALLEKAVKNRDERIQALETELQAAKRGELGDEIAVLEAVNKEVTEELRILRETYNQTAEELARATTELQKLKGQSSGRLPIIKESVQAQQRPHPIVKEVCQNLPDVVRVLEAYFPNRLFFTDKAKRTAKEHNGQLDCSIVWDMLMDINDHLYPLLFEKSFKGPLETAFGQRSRFGLALKETDLTMSNAAMEREREDGYREETIVAWSHVTHGGGANTTRIHYWVDKERQLIVISAIVDHYTTSGTKRHGH
ncbi:MAG: hypothetical protein A2Z91_00875 [Deltaproteobacteria bacterium GWA2_38_16]|nr:MAG: hypothetical protein A2Z91_00875 [Deltaproteobacteria bacterium GWA2_38_16]OGQ03650.1 MAG: hypothetical protein A3D19_02280 [Deltaproteobacteria bacterium RIFCSPHIGHO2_02_FULL_38_15]OGQ33982.1 MAG: hypothetical protein A3A72_04270 [Deltaproteobacteria bacterium RIFCSPLOWO2_01_FULL_38_9]HBQ21828.1 hypothetical protein [Deltaproteobacteria bacterium]